MHVRGDASGVAVTGLPAAISIVHAEPTDQLRIDGRGGDDAIEAAALSADALALTWTVAMEPTFSSGGGRRRADRQRRRRPADRRPPGLDTLDGGPCANVLIQD
jgi:hypothetical protein